MTLAAVDVLHHSFPGAEKWPIACAGFSGGAKCVGYIGPLLAKNRCHVIGIFMTGVSEDHLSDAYTKVRPGAGFLNTPIYISAGRDDPIATVEQQYNVAGAIKRTGFQRIRIGTFHGGHEGNDAQTSIALRWFWGQLWGREVYSTPAPRGLALLERPQVYSEILFFS
jgi:predicted esterase